MKGSFEDLTTPAMRARYGPAAMNGHAKPPPTTMFETAPAPKLPIIGLPPGAIELGRDEHDRPFGIDLKDLLAGRMLIQGNSGAGKSWLLRKLLEESTGQVQQIILDPEQEFRSLAELSDYPIVDAHRLDLNGAITLGSRIREQRQSVVIDLSELERDRQMMFIASFLPALIDAPQEHWQPALVAIDEAHLFAPLGGQGFEGPMVRKRAVSAVVDLMSRGRKRGLAAVLATQRFARLSKSVASEASNFMIGINTLDLDIRRAAETIGWDARRGVDRLPLLKPGQFVAVGPAFLPDSPLSVQIGNVKSRHMGATPTLSAPGHLGAEEGAAMLGLEDLAREAVQTEQGMPIGARAVRDFLRDPTASLAARIFAELQPIYPEGSTIASLAKHFATTTHQVSRAVALLGTYGAVDTVGDPGPGLGVRMDKSMRP